MSDPCQSILWRLVLFKLGTDLHRAHDAGSLRWTSHYVMWYDNPVSQGLILIDSLMRLGNPSPPHWGQDLSDLTLFKGAAQTAASLILSVRWVWYAHWSRNTDLIYDELLGLLDLWIPLWISSSRALHLRVIELVRKLHWPWLYSRSINQINICDCVSSTLPQPSAYDLPVVQHLGYIMQVDAFRIFG
jgi:hypothetical protein